MDSETFGRFVVTFFQSMKDWPILSLAVAGVFMLVGIPIVMLSKRLLDKLVPTRDSRMQSLLEDRGGLVEQVAQWRGTAEKALAGERSLIEQTTDLSRQLADAKKQRVSEPGADVGAELKISELERRVATLRQLLDDKSHELQERDVVAENALASQRALMDQVTDLNGRLTEKHQLLTAESSKSKGLLESLIAEQQNHRLTASILRKQAARIVRTPLLLETELYEVIYAALEEVMSVNGGKIPSVEELLSSRKGEVNRLTLEADGERKFSVEQIDPSQEMKTILKKLYENFYKRWDDSGFIHNLVDPNLLTIHVPSLTQPYGGAIASYQSPSTIGDVIVRTSMSKILERIDKIIPGIPVLKCKFEWVDMLGEGSGDGQNDYDENK